MADSQILMELKIVEKGGKISIVAQNMEKLAKETNKVDAAQKKAGKSADGFHTKQKGVAQAGMNTTKAFSKMQENMGGSSGLVGAYATLAANVFAATAAFNALRGAAQVQTLAEGFGFLAGVSGRTSEVIAGNIQRITGNALSMEEALRTAAIGIQSGFSSTQLERLTAVAKNASIALGRNLGDSVDRLVRGVAKLEPEILDELGIIVRLNTATENYANKIGKAVSDLSEFERQQAFLNATLEQGELKYGALGDAVDVNPFDKLAGSFTNLSNKVLGFLSSALSPLISLFSNSQLAMAGALTLFGSTIVTQMLPGLADLTTRQLENAKAAHTQADAQATAGEKIAKAQRKLVSKGGDVASPAGFAKLQKRLKKGKASAKDMQTGLDSLKRSEAQREAKLSGYSGKELKRKEEEIEEIRRLKRETEKLIDVEGNRGKLTTGGVLAAGKADRADITAVGVGNIQQAGAVGGFKEAFKQNKELRKSLAKTKIEIGKTGNGIKQFGAKSLAGFRTAGMGAKLFGTALLNAIPVIGQIIMAVGVVITLFKKFAGSSEKVNSGISNLDKVGSTYAKKQEALRKVQARVNDLLEIENAKLGENANAFAKAALEGQKYANTIKFQAGVIGEFVDSSAQLQNALQADGVGLFTVAINGLKNMLHNTKQAFFGFIGWIKETYRSMLEWGAAMPMVGGKFQEILDNMDAQEDRLARGSREMKIFKDTQLRAFDNITDPAIRAKIEANFGDGGLKGALEEAEDAVLNGGKTFSQATAGIIEKLEASGKAAKESDEAITGFGSSFQELSKQLNKSAQKETKKNEFTVLRDQLESFRKTAITLVKEHGIDRAREQLSALVPDGVHKQLESLGLSFEDLLQATDDKGNLSTFIESMSKAAILSERIITLKAENKSAVAADKKATDKAIERFHIEQSIESIRARGTGALLGSQEMAAAANTYNLRIKNANDEENRLLDIQEKTHQNALDKINARTDFEGEAGAKKKATMLQDAIDANIAAKALIVEEADFTEAKLKNARQKAVDKAGTTGTTVDRMKQIGEANIFGKVSFDEKGNKTTEKGIGTAQQKIQKLRDSFGPMMDELSALGPEGAFMSSVASGALNIASAIQTIGDKGTDTAGKLDAVKSVIQSFGAIAAASSKARIKGIDDEIAREKARDGKSKESLQKIKELEAKKEQMKRKAFETDKKTKLAAAVMNTASAAMAAISPPNPPLPYSAPMFAMALAMGAMQIATIAKMKYAGGGSAPSGAASPQSISVGKRNNKVDVSKSAGAGELSYLRGEKGIGTNANNFRPGGAAGMRRGYANGGEILVGERGPEVIEPRAGFEVTPNDKIGGQNLNANITINAVDAAGVEEVLTAQTGTIINMLQQAAHEHGEEFIEAVNPSSYGGGTGG